MSQVKVLHRLVVSFQILKNGTPIEVKIRIGFLQGFLGLRVSFKSMLQFFGALIVNEKVCQVSVAQNVPTLRIRQVKSYCFRGHLDAELVILFSLLSIQFVAVGVSL